MAAVRASTRVSVTWAGSEPYEDTDTLVLTINSWSLDLRVFNSGAHAGEIDWSTVARVSELSTSTSDNPQLKWDHIIDSRPPTDMEDQGTFTSLPDGDVEERGIMYNPKTKEYEEYVERWRRYTGGEGERYCVLEKMQEGGRSFVGCIGGRALGLGKDNHGRFSAWRAERRGGSSVRVFEQDAAGLPDLPVDLPETWKEGDEIELSGSTWVVRTIGTV